MSEEPKKRSYTVTIPMAGHLIIDVEATSEEQAFDIAMDTATIEHLDYWEQLEQFNRGNVCYCPGPWEIEAIDNGEVGE